MIADYYRILGLRRGCSADEVKRAYRQKARLLHPDINPSPGATEAFIKVNEAYLFLLKYLNRTQKEEREEYLREWKRYRREQARARAGDYSRIKYGEFKNKQVYRNARVFDGTLSVYGILISLVIMFISVYGYSLLKQSSHETGEEPSLPFMIALLITGAVFLIISLSSLMLSIKNYKNENR